MVVAVRAEAVLTAQNKLRPGLAQAAAEMSRFRAMQTKAMAAFGSSAARAMSAVSQRSSAAMAAAQGRILAAGRSQLLTLGGPAALAGSYKQYADVDRQITRIGITANASAEELGGVRKQIEGIAWETAQSSGKVTGGLDVLVAQGRDLKDALGFLPSVARTAAAAGAEVDDIAKSADAVANNFKIAGTQMQRAFDIMVEGGKAGTFELKDQARYLPSMAPAASAAGFSGIQGVTDLVSMLQIIRKGSGSSEEAASSMSNIFQKMESEETAKRFSKFGVNLRKEMQKARKEGRNLVSVFEDLTDKALKGDLSKLPQLFSDAEFARGMRALMSYRGEWQKLAKTIAKDAPGSVARDLTRVTNDARAQIDHMFAAIENRAVQVGGVLAKYVVMPLDKSLRDIEDGKNSTVNRVNEWASNYVNDVIANSELDGGTVHDYDPASRKKINARKDFLTPQKIEDARGKILSEIEALEAKRKRMAAETVAGNEILPPHLAEANSSRASGDMVAVEGQISRLRDQLRDIESLVSAIGNLNQSLAEVQGARDKALSPRMSTPNVSADVEALAEAGRNAGRQFTEALTAELAKATSDIAPQIARLKAMMSFTSSPSINPRVNGSVSGLPTGHQGPE